MPPLPKLSVRKQKLNKAVIEWLVAGSRQQKADHWVVRDVVLELTQPGLASSWRSWPGPAHCLAPMFHSGYCSFSSSLFIEQVAAVTFPTHITTLFFLLWRPQISELEAYSCVEKMFVAKSEVTTKQMFL